MTHSFPTRRSSDLRFYSADFPAGTPFSKVCRVYRFRHVRILPPIPICALCAYSAPRSEEHTSELQSLMRISYAVFCLTKKTDKTNTRTTTAHKIQSTHPNETHTRKN